ncbi:HNH endonuclease [bacterium]|jgi:hypothetical protein|nr:HNH endonuclease [bacterium]
MKTLHEKAVAFAKTYLKSESDLILVLQEIDRRKGYRELGFKSLFEYARSLGLSESVAYNLIVVARKALEVPTLQERLQAQEITLSNARTITSVLNSANQEKWIEKACTLSKRELEKEIAKEFPEKSVPETTRYLAENRVELRLGISEALLKKLKRIQDLESKQDAASLEQTLEAMAESYLSKHDPIEKAKRARKPVPEQVFSTTPAVHAHLNTRKRFYPAPLKHAVHLRDQVQCTHVTHNKRCTERRWLDIHHKKPLSQGGQTTLDNLTTLCRGHHRLLHHGR